jgi:hypothetical protein
MISENSPVFVPVSSHGAPVQSASSQTSVAQKSSAAEDSRSFAREQDSSPRASYASAGGWVMAG